MLFYEVWYKSTGRMDSVVYAAIDAEEARQQFYRQHTGRIVHVLLAL